MQSGIRKKIAVVAALTLWLGGAAASQEVREITYALPSKSLVSSAPRIADELGLFAKRGLRPKFTYIESNAQTAGAVISRSVEFGQTATAEVITAAAKGQNLVFVAKHYNGLAGSLVLSKKAVERLGVSPDAPAATRLKALNNLLLASVSKISSLTIAYKGAANAVGAEPRFSYLAVNAMPAALDAGAVDGIIVTAPFWTQPVVKGTGVLWLSPAKGDLPPEFVPSTPSATITTRAFAESNPEVVNKVADVFGELSDVLVKRSSEVKQIIAKLYPDLDDRTLDLILVLEGGAFVTKPLTSAELAHDVEYMRKAGGDYGPIEKLDPSSLLLKR